MTKNKVKIKWEREISKNDKPHTNEKKTGKNENTDHLKERKRTRSTKQRNRKKNEAAENGINMSETNNKKWRKINIAKGRTIEANQTKKRNRKSKKIRRNKNKTCGKR